MIIIVTGSRDWRYPKFVSAMMNVIYTRHGLFTLYHGDCRDKNGNPAGADKHANDWAETIRGMDIERFPANFRERGPVAGPERNDRMMLQAATAMSRGEDALCVAFRRHENSKGTNSALRYAAQYGIPVYGGRPFGEYDVPPALSLQG